MTETKPPTMFQGFFDYPVSITDDEVAVAALQRACVREMHAQANSVRQRLGTPEVVEEAPLVAIAPADDDESFTLTFRPPADGEESTHTRRVLHAPILTSQSTPDEAMHETAAQQLERIEAVGTIDRTDWPRARWVAEAKTLMSGDGGTIRALQDNHVLALLGALTEFEEGFANMAVAEPAEDGVKIEADFIERVADAMAKVRDDRDRPFHMLGLAPSQCGCGWPGTGNATMRALDRHIQTVNALALVEALIAAKALPPFAYTREALGLPDGIRLGHCDLCGQVLIKDNTRGEPAYHPHNVATPCPPPPAPGADDYGALSGRPGDGHFVDDDAPLEPPTPARSPFPGPPASFVNFDIDPTPQEGSTP